MGFTHPTAAFAGIFLSIACAISAYPAISDINKQFESLDGIDPVNPECLTHSELLALDEDSVVNSIPCDIIGSYYILGVSPAISNEVVAGSIDQYSFYAPTRIFLRRSTRSEESAEYLSYIAIASSLMVAEINSGAMSPKRGATYQAFFLSEYLKQHLPAKQPKVVPEDEIRSGFAIQALSELALIGGFETISEAACFVRYDIPTLLVEEIRLSENYLTCVKGN